MNKQISLILALIMSTCFGLVGCYQDCPDDGGDPNKEDTIQMGEYTPIYELDADGYLKHLPIPFVDFTEGELPLKKWEAAHGAMLTKEVVSDFQGQQIKNYVFNTQDKSGKQPLRIYLVSNAGKGKLQISTLLIDKKLVYNEQGEIRQEFDMMTINDGFTALDSISSKTPMYRKGNLIVGVSQSKDQAGYAQLSFLPMPGSVAKIDLDKTLKDFPFASKKAEETSLDDIRKYETALGLRREKSLNDPKRATFVTKDKNKGNFDLVAYYPQGYTSKGTTYEPGILAFSYALTIDMFESNPDVAEWFVNNGFSKPQKTKVGNSAYSSENDYYTLLITEAQTGIVFMFSAKKKAPTPPPAEDTSIFPSYNFGEMFNPADEPTPGTPAGPIYTSEMAKGEDVTYMAPKKGKDGKIHYSEVCLKVSIKDPLKEKTAAIKGYCYYPSHDATEATMHIYDNGALDINPAKKFKTGIDKELKAALEKAGYQYTGNGKSSLGNDVWYYYNKDFNISLHVLKITIVDSQIMSVAFWRGDDYKPQAGKQIRPNTRYMHH